MGRFEVVLRLDGARVEVGFSDMAAAETGGPPGAGGRRAASLGVGKRGEKRGEGGWEGGGCGRE